MLKLTQQELDSLREFCSKPERVKLSKLESSKTVENKTVINSTVKIPAFEKPNSKFFVEPVVVVTDKTQLGSNFLALIAGFLTKNPRLKFIESTKSNLSVKRLFWFRDTINNNKIVVTKAELSTVITDKRLLIRNSKNIDVKDVPHCDTPRAILKS